MLDRVTRLDETIAGPGKKLTFRYTLTSSQRIDFVALGKILESETCDEDWAKRYLNNKVAIHYSYQDMSGKLLFKKSIEPSFCSENR